MHQRLILLLFLIAICPFASSDDVQRQDQLVWDYAEFLEAFSSRNWRDITRFINSETKIGFGGEMGMTGLLQVFGENDDCHESMVRVLEMGCRKTGEGEAMRCVSPPHLGPEVIYLGARASFAYNPKEKLWMPEFLICGGD